MIIFFIFFLTLSYNNILWVLVALSFGVGLKIFSNNKSVIVRLLMLEVHTMLGLLVLVLNSFNLNGSLFIVYITIVVCEAVLGLRILIFSSRYKISEIIILP
jgi:hypothetical protein